MAAKKHITLDVLLTAGLSLRSKKERRARIAASYPPFHTTIRTSVEKKPARAFYTLSLWIYLLF